MVTPLKTKVVDSLSSIEVSLGTTRPSLSLAAPPPIDMMTAFDPNTMVKGMAIEKQGVPLDPLADPKGRHARGDDGVSIRHVVLGVVLINLTLPPLTITNYFREATPGEASMDSTP